MDCGTAIAQMTITMRCRAFKEMLTGALLTFFVSAAAFGNAYAELGVRDGATDDEIRKAYIRILRVVHEGGSAPDPLKYKSANVAYQALQSSKPKQQFELSEADRFRAFVASRVEGSEKTRARSGAMAQYFALFYDGTGKFIDARVLLMILGISPHASLVYDMQKELAKTSDSIASQIQFARGNFAQREFVRNFYNGDLVEGILSQMSYFANDIALVSGSPGWPPARIEDLRNAFVGNVGEMLTNLGFGCSADMKNCLLRLLEGIEESEPLLQLIDPNNAKILIGLIDKVIEGEPRSWIFHHEYFRLQAFRRKIVGLHQNTAVIYFQSCESFMKDTFRKIRRK